MHGLDSFPHQLLMQGGALVLVILTLIEEQIVRSRPAWLARFAYLDLADREVPLPAELRLGTSESATAANYRTSALGGLDVERLHGLTGRVFTSRSDGAWTAFGIPLEWSMRDSKFGGVVRIDMIAGAESVHLRARATPSPILSTLPATVLVFLVVPANTLMFLVIIGAFIFGTLYGKAKARKTLTPHATLAIEQIVGRLTEARS